MRAKVTHKRGSLFYSCQAQCFRMFVTVARRRTIENSYKQDAHASAKFQRHGKDPQLERTLATSGKSKQHCVVSGSQAALRPQSYDLI